MNTAIIRVYIYKPEMSGITPAFWFTNIRWEIYGVSFNDNKILCKEITKDEEEQYGKFFDDFKDGKHLVEYWVEYKYYSHSIGENKWKRTPRFNFIRKLEENEETPLLIVTMVPCKKCKEPCDYIDTLDKYYCFECKRWADDCCGDGKCIKCRRGDAA